jgi:hypothetical protein
MTMMKSLSSPIAASATVLLLTMLVDFNYPHLAGNALENTRWKGTVYTDEPIEAIFEFKKDTMLMIYQGAVVETMTYQADASTLTIKKVSGGNPKRSCIFSH